MWYLLMLVILFTNGMSAFGLKIISTWGLPENAKFPYLTIWYGAGFICIALPMLLKRTRANLKELGWGAVMAVLSIGGQVAMAIALNAKLPGSVVFPVTSGAAIILVGVAGRLFFGERMNPMTSVGLVLGFLSVILLSIS